MKEIKFVCDRARNICEEAGSEERPLHLPKSGENLENQKFISCAYKKQYRVKDKSKKNQERKGIRIYDWEMM